MTTFAGRKKRESFLREIIDIFTRNHGYFSKHVFSQ